MALKYTRFFLCKDTDSSIRLDVPLAKHFMSEYEVTMRDCSRQIHWLFSTDKKGLAKAKKVAELFTSIATEIEEKLND